MFCFVFISGGQPTIGLSVTLVKEDKRTWLHEQDGGGTHYSPILNTNFLFLIPYQKLPFIDDE
jgi:hypothetical protein